MAEPAVNIDGWPEGSLDEEFPPIPYLEPRRLWFSNKDFSFFVEVNRYAETMYVERYKKDGKWCGFVRDAPVDPSLSDADLAQAAARAVHEHYLAVAAELFPL